MRQTSHWRNLPQTSYGSLGFAIVIHLVCMCIHGHVCMVTQLIALQVTALHNHSIIQQLGCSMLSAH